MGTCGFGFPFNSHSSVGSLEALSVDLLSLEALSVCLPRTHSSWPAGGCFRACSMLWSLRGESQLPSWYTLGGLPALWTSECAQCGHDRPESLGSEEPTRDIIVGSAPRQTDFPAFHPRKMLSSSPSLPSASCFLSCSLFIFPSSRPPYSFLLPDILFPLLCLPSPEPFQPASSAPRCSLNLHSRFLDLLIWDRQCGSVWPGERHGTGV